MLASRRSTWVDEWRWCGLGSAGAAGQRRGVGGGSHQTSCGTSVIVSPLNRSTLVLFAFSRSTAAPGTMSSTALDAAMTRCALFHKGPLYFCWSNLTIMGPFSALSWFDPLNTNFSNTKFGPVIYKKKVCHLLLVCAAVAALDFICYC